MEDLVKVDPKKLTRFHPATILANARKLEERAEMYFRLLPVRADDTAPNDTPALVHTQEPPTPAGLALFLGFSSAQAMLNAADNEDYPLESRHVLARALTTIEDRLVAAGLMDNVNVTMAKFVLSARLNMVEKSERHTTSDTITDIRIHGLADDLVGAASSAGPDHPGLQASPKEARPKIDLQLEGLL